MNENGHFISFLRYMIQLFKAKKEFLNFSSRLLDHKKLFEISVLNLNLIILLKNKKNLYIVTYNQPEASCYERKELNVTYLQNLPTYRETD